MSRGVVLGVSLGVVFTVMLFSGCVGSFRIALILLPAVGCCFYSKKCSLWIWMEWTGNFFHSFFIFFAGLGGSQLDSFQCCSGLVFFSIFYSFLLYLM